MAIDPTIPFSGGRAAACDVVSFRHACIVTASILLSQLTDGTAISTEDAAHICSAVRDLTAVYDGGNP